MEHAEHANELTFHTSCSPLIRVARQVDLQVSSLPQLTNLQVRCLQRLARETFGAVTRGEKGQTTAQ
jgi:hypothetical protein